MPDTSPLWVFETEICTGEAKNSVAPSSLIQDGSFQLFTTPSKMSAAWIADSQVVGIRA